MDVAPSRASGLRMQEVGDRLIVSFVPRRSGLVFLLFWLVGWTFGGVVAWLAVPKLGAGGAAFVLFWLCGWFFGECSAICAIAWMLFGHLSLAVTGDELEVRRQLAGFSWLKRYETAHIQEIGVARMPDGEDGLHKDFSLRLSCDDGRTVWIGERMGEREAEHVASVVLSRIRRTSWWDDEHEIRSRVRVEAAGCFPLVAPGHRKAFLVLGIVITAGMLLGVPLLRRSQHHQSARGTQPAPRAVTTHAFPARSAFVNARDYAEAVTSWAVNSGRPGRLALASEPHCDAHATWRQWSCTALVRWDQPTQSAGLAVPYRCRSDGAGGVTCGLAMRPPPVAGKP
jgi:hypothetical protein